MALLPRRIRPILPPFVPAVPPDPREARIDKLTIAFPNIMVECTDQRALESKLWQLAPSTRDRGERYNEDQAIRPNLFSVNARNLSIKVNDGWLFTGEGKVLGLRSTRNAIGQTIQTGRLKLTLELNPSRFYAHAGRPALRGRATIEDCERLLRVPANAEGNASRFTLDGNDNVLPLEMVPEARPFLRYTMRFVAMVLKLVKYRLLEISDPLLEHDDAWGDRSGVDFDCRIIPNWRGWQVHHAEVYHEYLDRNVLGTVHRLAPRLHAAAEEAETAPYPVPRPIPAREPEQPRWRTLRNAVSTTVELGAKSVQLAAYAKEFDRLRIEVRYKCNLRQALGRIGVAGERLGCLSVEQRQPDAARRAPLIALRTLLNFAIQDANERMSRVFTQLCGMDEEPPLSLEGITELFGHVFAAARGDQENASRLMALLVHTHAVSMPEISRELRFATRRLVRDGVLVEARAERVRKAERYRLAPRYMQAALALQERLSRFPK